MLLISSERRKVFTLDRLRRSCYSIFLPIFLTENHQICILYQETFIRIVLKNSVKSHLKIFLNNVVISIHAEKNNLYFYKISANQTFTFISSKVVYFKKHLANQVQHLQGMKFSLPIHIPYRRQTINLAVGAMVEPFHT